jgi:hypothetical protein
VLDIVERARFWLRDAARGRLILEQDAFETTRIYDTFGEVIFDPEALRAKVATAWTANGGADGFLLVFYQLLDKEAKDTVAVTGYAVREIVIVQPDAADTLLKVARRINILADEPAYQKQVQKCLFGVLAWGRDSSITTEYFGELPNKLGALFEWANKLGIPLGNALTTYLDGDFQLLGGIPVTVAIRRPCRLIGGASDLAG